MFKTSSEVNKRENLCKLGIFCSAVGVKYDFKNLIFSSLKYFITGHPNVNKVASNFKNLCKIKYSIIEMLRICIFLMVGCFHGKLFFDYMKSF